MLMVAELVQPWLLREEEDGCGGDCGNGAGTVAVVLSLLVRRGPCAAEVGCALVEARNKMEARCSWWLMEMTTRMEEDGGGARSCWTREEDGVAVRGAEKVRCGVAAVSGEFQWWSARRWRRRLPW